MGPPGLLRGLSRGGLGLELTLDESVEREVLTVLLIRSRWYCRSCCLASETRPERGWEVIERELRADGGAGLESFDGKFAGWYLGSLVRLRHCAGALLFWLLLIEGKGTDALGERGEEGLIRDDSDFGPIWAEPVCTAEGSRMSEVFFAREE